MNHEMMWKELKEKVQTLADEDGLIILSDIEEMIEELEIDWTQLIKFKK